MTRPGGTLDVGFRIEDPDVTVPWGSSLTQVLRSLTDPGRSHPQRVAAGYLTTACRALGGLNVKVGFHFEPETDAGVLREIEIFENGRSEIAASYQLFHEKLVEQFGRPTIEKPGPLGDSMPSCEWRVGSASIVHYVMDRFGPEEHLRIRKGASTLNTTRVISAILVSLGALAGYSWCAGAR